jgi:hypothetical protein
VNEPGHVQSVAVPSAVDWDLKVQWYTDYNAVGTSKTEPQFLSLKHKSSLGSHKTARSIYVILRERDGTIIATQTQNCIIPTRTSYDNCYTSVAGPGALLSANPELVLYYYTSPNRTGSLITSSVYRYP